MSNRELDSIESLLYIALTFMSLNVIQIIHNHMPHKIADVH